MIENIKNIIYIDEYAKYERTDNHPYVSEYISDSDRLCVIHQPNGALDTLLKNSVHIHNFYEAEFIYSGKGFHILNSSSFEIKKGSVYFRAPNSIHTTLQDKNHTIKSYKLQFSQSMIPQSMTSLLLNGANTFSIEFENSELDKMTEKLEELKNEIDTDKPYRNIMIKTLFETILISLIRHENKMCISPSHSSYVSAVLKYIGQNFKDELSVKEIAANLHLNPHYLGTVFKKEVGCGILEYAFAVKMQLASHLLVNTNMPINEISAECGYNNPTYFISSFKRNFGITPLKYRQKQLL